MEFKEGAHNSNVLRSLIVFHWTIAAKYIIVCSTVYTDHLIRMSLSSHEFVRRFPKRRQSKVLRESALRSDSFGYEKKNLSVFYDKSLGQSMRTT